MLSHKEKMAEMAAKLAALKASNAERRANLEKLRASVGEKKKEYEDLKAKPEDPQVAALRKKAAGMNRKLARQKAFAKQADKGFAQEDRARDEGHDIQVGPKGARFYINKAGKKIYIKGPGALPK